MKINKAIVTGGCGFIGSHIVDKLVESGVDVIVIDNLSADNEKFYYNEKATYYHIDICHTDLISHLFQDIDIVFHLAAESRIGPTITDPAKATRVNVFGTLSVLECCRKHNIKRVVYSSTSACYGLINPVPMKESMSRDCLNPYATTKCCGEDLCVMYNRCYNLSTVCLRYFNVYGDRSPTTGPYAPVMGIFIEQAKQNIPLSIVGDGLQRRDFIHVSDIVEANIEAAICEDDVGGQVFNVGSGTNYSILELAKLISSDYRYVPQRPGEARHTLSDNNKINSMFGWTPKKSVIEYIKEKINE